MDHASAYKNASSICELCHGTHRMVVPQLVALGSCSIVCAVVFVLTLKSRNNNRDGKSDTHRAGPRCKHSGNKGKRPQRAATSRQLTFKPGMQEHEYLPLIPKAERRQLQAVIHEAQAARGWAYSPPAFDSAWEEVLTAACTPEGGGWADVFDPVQAMTPSSLSRLADLIDRLLLGGTLQTWLRQQGRPPISFLGVDWVQGEDDWVSYFDLPTTTAVFLRPKWGHARLGGLGGGGGVLSCEGVACTTPLQVLARTLGHELIHALVAVRWPDIDASSPAYLPDDRHGPVFALLARHLLGHCAETFRHVLGTRPDPTATAAATQPSHSPPYDAVPLPEGALAEGRDGHTWIVRTGNRTGDPVWVHHAAHWEQERVYLVGGDGSSSSCGTNSGDSSVVSAAGGGVSGGSGNGRSGSTGVDGAGGAPISLSGTDVASHGWQYMVRVTPRSVDLYTTNNNYNNSSEPRDDTRIIHCSPGAQGTPPPSPPPHVPGVLLHTFVGRPHVIAAEAATRGTGNAGSGAEGSAASSADEGAAAGAEGGATGGWEGDGGCMLCPGLLVRASPTQWLCLGHGRAVGFTLPAGERMVQLISAGRGHAAGPGVSTGAGDGELSGEGRSHRFERADIGSSEGVSCISEAGCVGGHESQPALFAVGETRVYCMASGRSLTRSVLQSAGVALQPEQLRRVFEGCSNKHGEGGACFNRVKLKVLHEK